MDGKKVVKGVLIGIGVIAGFNIITGVTFKLIQKYQDKQKIKWAEETVKEIRAMGSDKEEDIVE